LNVVIAGVLTAIDAYLTQSHDAEQFQACGVWTGNSLVIASIATILLSGFMALCGPFMQSS
jgi:hypothetical protein